MHLCSGFWLDSSGCLFTLCFIHLVSMICYVCCKRRCCKGVVVRMPLVSLVICCLKLMWLISYQEKSSVAFNKYCCYFFWNHNIPYVFLFFFHPNILLRHTERTELTGQRQRDRDRETERETESKIKITKSSTIVLYILGVPLSRVQGYLFTLT